MTTMMRRSRKSTFKVDIADSNFVLTPYNLPLARQIFDHIASVLNPRLVVKIIILCFLVLKKFERQELQAKR